MKCDRKGCNGLVTEDWLYCSAECYDRDNSDIPVMPRVRHKSMKDTRFGERQRVDLKTLRS